MGKVDLEEKFSRFAERRHPKAVGELNGQEVKLPGPFTPYHQRCGRAVHFVKGRFRMKFRGRDVWLEGGEFPFVPRNVEHGPVADEEAHVLLFEPAGTRNTGNVRNELTVPEARV